MSTQPRFLLHESSLSAQSLRDTHLQVHFDAISRVNSISPDNTYDILINNDSKKKGSLLEDFEPPVNPSKEIGK